MVKNQLVDAPLSFLHSLNVSCIQTKRFHRVCQQLAAQARISTEVRCIFIYGPHQCFCVSLLAAHIGPSCCASTADPIYKPYFLDGCLWHSLLQTRIFFRIQLKHQIWWRLLDSNQWPHACEYPMVMIFAAFEVNLRYFTGDFVIPNFRQLHCLRIAFSACGSDCGASHDPHFLVAVGTVLQ